MELSAYISLFRRWLWLIMLCAVIAASVSFVAARTQPPRYQASTTVQVGAYSSLANPSAGMISTAEQLAQTYVALANTYPVLDAVAKKLRLDVAPDSLSRLFTTRLVSGTSLLTITVTYTDPVVAADIANELATQLILNSPTNLTDAQKQQLSILQTEITQAQVRLQTAREELRTVETGIASITDTSSQDRTILTARQTELVNQINTTQANLAQMSSTAASLQQEGQINSLKVVEPSRIPENPIGGSPLTSTLVAAAVGAVLAIGVGFLIEYLNDSIRAPSEVLPLLSTPLIGTIAPFGSRRNYKNKLITWLQPRSSVAEAYRALRVNLLYRASSLDKAPDEVKCRLFAVTSPGPSEGKSVTVANLAITFAITGMRVLLIDTDLRRPAIHLLFNLPNTTGVASLWRRTQGARGNTFNRQPSPISADNGNKDVRSGQPVTGPEISQLQVESRGFPQFVQKTEIPGLDVVTAGPSPSNPAELLGTAEMQNFVEQIIRSGLYDAVFFDTPPVLVVSDASVVCSVSKAEVILVASSGITRRAAAVRAVDQLTVLGLPILGVVLNRLNPRDVDAGYGQYYYGYNKYTDNSPRVKQSDPV